MATQAQQQKTISARLIGQWDQVNEKLLALAEEIPESQFDFQPAKEIRKVAEVLRHVAFWNQYVADTVRGEKADDAANELPKEKFATKKLILNALKSTAQDASHAMREHSSGLSPETAEMVVNFIEHNCEHYGQLVVYARIKGIVPPASRS